jgi:hypothetical protein
MLSEIWAKPMMLYVGVLLSERLSSGELFLTYPAVTEKVNIISVLNR